MRSALTSSLKLLAPSQRREGSKSILANIISLVWIVFFLLPQTALAHGVEGEVTLFSGGVVVTATYDTGEPMSYAKVEVYAPDSKIKFQTGRTDRNGRFAFVPDMPGKWRVIISDGIGHQLELAVEVKSLAHGKTEIQKTADTNHRVFISRKTAAIMGVLLIFGIFGWIKEFWQIKRRPGPR